MKRGFRWTIRLASIKNAWSAAKHVKELKEPTTQHFIPNDKHLHEKIGVEKNQKVLVFAGCYGDWANSLSKFSSVRYTDIGQEMTQYAKSRFSGAVSSFRASPAELVPQRARVFDWSFSFEPYPLIRTGGLEMALVRSLINTKGAKIVFNVLKEAGHVKWRGMKHSQCEALAKRVAKRYGAEVDVKVVDINGTRSISSAHKDVGNKSCLIVTLKTNSRARKKALFDLSVLKFLGLEDKINEKVIKKTARELGVSPEAVWQAHRRIEEIKGLAFFSSP